MKTQTKLVSIFFAVGVLSYVMASGVTNVVLNPAVANTKYVGNGNSFMASSATAGASKWNNLMFVIGNGAPVQFGAFSNSLQKFNPGTYSTGFSNGGSVGSDLPTADLTTNSEPSVTTSGCAYNQRKGVSLTEIWVSCSNGTGGIQYVKVASTGVCTSSLNAVGHCSPPFTYGGFYVGAFVDSSDNIIDFVNI